MSLLIKAVLVGLKSEVECEVKEQASKFRTSQEESLKKDHSDEEVAILLAEYDDSSKGDLELVSKSLDSFVVEADKYFGKNPEMLSHICGIISALPDNAEDAISAVMKTLVSKGVAESEVLPERVTSFLPYVNKFITRAKSVAAIWKGTEKVKEASKDVRKLFTRFLGE